MTRWGRYVFAIGGNQRAARLTGLPVKQIKVSVYMLQWPDGGITSIFLVGWLGSVTNALGQGDELRVIAGTVIGGASLAGGYGTAYGAMIGSLLIEEIRNAFFWPASTLSGRAALSEGSSSSRSSCRDFRFETKRRSKNKTLEFDIRNHCHLGSIGRIET